MTTPMAHIFLSTHGGNKDDNGKGLKEDRKR